jgi:hypothetical protein
MPDQSVQPSEPLELLPWSPPRLDRIGVAAVTDFTGGPGSDISSSSIGAVS